jgi:hypothetical protein
LCRGSRLATCYSEALKRLRNLQYVRRPGPDSGCSAIGWMDGIVPNIIKYSDERPLKLIYPLVSEYSHFNRITIVKGGF